MGSGIPNSPKIILRLIRIEHINLGRGSRTPAKQRRRKKAIPQKVHSTLRDCNPKTCPGLENPKENQTSASKNEKAKDTEVVFERVEGKENILLHRG
jgi:hypothetical protein